MFWSSSSFKINIIDYPPFNVIKVLLNIQYFATHNNKTTIKCAIRVCLLEVMGVLCVARPHESRGD